MPVELKNKIAQVNSFIDESFDIKRISDFQLVLQIGNDGIQATVYDKARDKYIAFEYFGFQNVFDADIVADLLDIAIKESKIINHKYRSVTCSIVNNFSTLVPNPLYEDDRKRMYLKFNASLQGDELVMTDDIKNLDSKNIFALPFSIKVKLDSLFQSVQYHHFSSTLIENLLSQAKNLTKKQFFIHVQPTHFEVVVIEGKKLIFYNTFNHHSAEDLIYYLLFVCEQLQLNPENMEAILIGEIEKTSAVYTVIHKYIRNIKFGERSTNSDYSYQLQTFPKHFYFTLFNNYLI